MMNELLVAGIATLSFVGCASTSPKQASPTQAAALVAPGAAADASVGAIESDAGKADRDGDQIADDIDRCPDQPETYNGFEDEDGCPDKGHYHPLAELKILTHVFFARSATGFDQDARAKVQALADTLQSHNEITVVEIAGLAAADEPDALVLSRKRAQAVVNALVAKGVAKDRLRVVGYGALCPNLAEGTDAQRMVRFTILRRTMTPAELGRADGSGSTMSGARATAEVETKETVGCEAATRAGITSTAVR